MLSDADGNYYAFGSDQLAAAQADDGSYEMDAGTLETARVPDDCRDAVEAAPGVDEVSGFTKDGHDATSETA